MASKEICLGIEGTAHTFGIGIVDGSANVLANEYVMYSPKEGGIHPREAANHHTEKAAEVIRNAMEKADISKDDISLIAFSQGPGLGPCLRTAATAARTLSLSLGIPLIGVNHCIAHLEIGRALCHCSDPVLLYVSGGNTQVISYANGRYRVFGETMDIGLGNMLDKFGREMGMPFPAGPNIERMAAKGNNLIQLPYSVKGMDVSFSGILTAALNKEGHSTEDICYSIQETTFAMLVEVTERAMAHLGKSEVLLGGGVVRNRRLFKMVSDMCQSRGAECFVPPPSLCSDNGAMIAWTGLIMHRAGIRMSLEETGINQRFRTDDVQVTWV
ncbi:MAG: bifunctional N(6)-L-threonylcarbamoyladenine synthase/serine/threonine protein kinase [Candidatus Thermoplasmatota archaeon]|nr:bifunctional N(6)-L-threonylcarbamoyladenine synthase/serine/threonine protein kinase [Euryarchaeota archaeon]MBU4031240.1 bifunctional N(6)-L-threonylcarbamoyladenine synthase/serine/threonine protein kinase [Candidatus Thermoplasmatota archaeon]MBU4071149.1 bifunctional N(6)-L-threonylcarbamoyladenine synthase/serine/threonine protein kinase [Candidatus Thermoplasmatota archaeon]MBU4144854.1 bifunctional N(6)-L-threonylcarbamoyladenine synthase/serine/threonine protein kinase [Candidatus Th